MSKALKLRVLGIDHGHIFDMLDKMLKNVDDLMNKIKSPHSWYAGLFNEITNKLDGIDSGEVKLIDAQKSLEFVTAVYNSSRTGKNVSLPINKDHPLYNSWLP